MTVVGSPRVVRAPKGKAVQFDGARDGLLLEVNPVAGARAFTIEAVIRPDAGGLEEQRWMHIQEASADNRIMLETRLRGTSGSSTPSSRTARSPRTAARSSTSPSSTPWAGGITSRSSTTAR